MSVDAQNGNSNSNSNSNGFTSTSTSTSTPASVEQEGFDLSLFMDSLNADVKSTSSPASSPASSPKQSQNFDPYTIDDIFKPTLAVNTADSLGVGLGKRFSSATPMMSRKMLQDMQHNHKEVIRLLITGMKPKAVAISLDIHINTVHNIKNSTLGKALSNQLHQSRDLTVAKSVERMEGLSPLALDVYEEILTNSMVDQKLKKDTAKDVLKGSGVMIDRRHIITDNPYITAEEATELKKRFKKTFNHDIEDAVIVSEANADADFETNINSIIQPENNNA